MKRFLLLTFTFVSIMQLKAQITEHDWTRTFYTGAGFTDHVGGISITELDYVYSIYTFKGFSCSDYFNTNINSNGNEDIMIDKTSKTRNPMWARHIGGAGLDRPTGVTQFSNGDVIIAGIFSDSVDFDPGLDTCWKVSQGQTDNFLLKLDQNGNFIKCITFGGSGNF